MSNQRLARGGELTVGRVQDLPRGQRSTMPGPHPEDVPADEPHEVERDATGQPETAPDGTAVSGFPEPAGKDPEDRRGGEDPHSSLNTPSATGDDA